MARNQSTMDRLLKRKLTPKSDNDNVDEGTSRDGRENIDGGTSKRDANTTNTKLQYVEKEGPTGAKRRQTRGLMDYLKDFDFVFHLQLMLLILGHANSLSLSLQRKDKDILEAISEV